MSYVSINNLGSHAVERMNILSLWGEKGDEPKLPFLVAKLNLTFGVCSASNKSVHSRERADQFAIQGELY